jgi:hypothetical protein
MKKCVICHVEQDIIEYTKSSSNKDGLVNRCKTCTKTYNAKYRLENKDTLKQKRLDNIENIRERDRISHQKCRLANPELHKLCLKKSYEKHKDKRLLEKQIYYIENQEEILQKKRVYGATEQSKSLQRAVKSRRRLLHKNATPSWADLNAIKEFYKNCPIGYHVDHIIPIKNKKVCGLHVLNNLQYLPASENLSKNNKFDGTLENNSWRFQYDR